LFSFVTAHVGIIKIIVKKNYVRSRSSVARVWRYRNLNITLLHHIIRPAVALIVGSYFIIVTCITDRICASTCQFYKSGTMFDTKVGELALTSFPPLFLLLAMICNFYGCVRLCGRMAKLLARTAEGSGFESWFGHLSRVDIL